MFCMVMNGVMIGQGNEVLGNNHGVLELILPFEHLGQSNLFTRVCRLFVN